MSVTNHKIFSIILGCIFLLFPGSGKINNAFINSEQPVFVTGNVSTVIKAVGYNSITSYGELFLAAGSEGRIDWISSSGSIINSEVFPGENFNCIISDNKTIIAAGDNGLLRISFDGKSFRKAESGTDSDINSLTIFNRTIIAGADNGRIITGDPRGSFNEISLNLKGNIMSLSSRSSDCYGATDEGEIIHSTDGINWDIFNFNNVYSGFYRPCSFSSILVTENRIAVAGKQDDGFPVVAFSSQGNVWTERVLNYVDEGGFREFLTESPNFIIYDETGDQFFIACTNGLIMVLPSCSQCNKVAKASDRNIKSMVIASGRIMLAGEGYFLKTIGTGW